MCFHHLNLSFPHLNLIGQNVMGLENSFPFLVSYLFSIFYLKQLHCKVISMLWSSIIFYIAFITLIMEKPT